MKNKVIEILDEIINEAYNHDKDGYNTLMPASSYYSIIKRICNYAKSRIQSLPDDDWIAVTDRLPDIDGYYLIAVQDSWVGYGDYTKKYSFYDVSVDGVSKESPTHWQPLPTPPLPLSPH